MFDEVRKYKNNDHFFFSKNSNLEEVCNAPKDKKGVFTIYELKNGRVNLVFIGSSGRIKNNGTISPSLSGLYDTIVNGHQFGNIPRKKSWNEKLINEDIDALDIYWYDTSSSGTVDIPAFVESELLQLYFDFHGKLPKWNE